MFLDDAVAHGEPEAGTVADAFSGEERVEYLVQILCRNSFTGVGHLDKDLVRLAGPCDQRDRAAVEHRVAGIENQDW